MRYREGAVVKTNFLYAGALLLLAPFANAAWPVLHKGEVICKTSESAFEQAHFYAQGIDDELADSKNCGYLKADTEYAQIGGITMKDPDGDVVKFIPLVRIRKNKVEVFHVSKESGL